MGQLVMSFRGINMHVNKCSGVLPADVQHRVVSVNAAMGLRVKDWGDVPAHYCFLEGAPEVLDALTAAGLPPEKGYVPLAGWHVQLLNPAGRKADVRLERVPAMKTFLHDMTLKPGIGNELELPGWAACFVDIGSGTVTTERFHTGAIYTTWTVETEGDPMLQFTYAAPDATPVPVPVQLRSTPPLAKLAHGVPGDIVLHNGTSDQTDKKFDFVLHFLANEGGIPTKQQLDQMFPVDPGPHVAFIDLTTSCSNSQYP